MRLSTSLIFIIFLCFVCTTTSKIKDEDFSEFDDFDQDEFTIGIETPSSTESTPVPETINNEDLTKTKEDEVTIDDDDDDSMFDDEEFETVIFRFRKSFFISNFLV